MLTDRARRCADLILAAHHLDDNWSRAHEPQDAEDMREDAIIGLAQALRHLAETSTPAAQFELTTLADELCPEVAGAAPTADALPSPSALSAALDRVVAAAELVIKGAEVGPSDTTPLEQLGEALDELRDLRQYGGG